MKNYGVREKATRAIFMMSYNEHTGVVPGLMTKEEAEAFVVGKDDRLEPIELSEAQIEFYKEWIKS